MGRAKRKLNINSNELEHFGQRATPNSKFQNKTLHIFFR